MLEADISIKTAYKLIKVANSHDTSFSTNGAALSWNMNEKPAYVFLKEVITHTEAIRLYNRKTLHGY